MKNIITAMALMLPFTAHAIDPAIGGSVFVSSDTADNTVQKIGASLWFDSEEEGIADQRFGVQYTDLRYTNPETSYNGQEIDLLVDWRSDDTWYMGHVGVANLEGETYISSDLSVMHFVNKNLIVSGGVYSDIVDSVPGLATGTTTWGSYAGFEIYNDRFGFTANIKGRSMSDDNSALHLISKAYMVVGNGVYVYLGDSRFVMDERSDLYWSPQNWERTNLGVGYRQRVNGYLVSARYDVGDTTTDGYSDSANSWEVLVESPRRGRWRGGLRVGSDLAPFNFQYDYGSIYFKLDW